MTKFRPFNQIMAELLEQSGLTRDELSAKLAGMPSCPLAQEQTSSPGIDLIKAMAEILKPSLQQEMELFRSVAVLIAMDPEKKFSEMFYAYRKGFGFSLENIGAKLENILTKEDNDPDFDILAALYETGGKIPNKEETQAIIKVFSLQDATEIANFTAKLSTTNKSAIQLVDKNFSDNTKLTPEKIAEAKTLLDQDISEKTKFITSEAAKILTDKKIDK